MTGQKRKKEKSHPINYVCFAFSLIIFGSFGLIFITQMELQPGWIWNELNEANSMEMRVFEGDDINGDGLPDIISYVDITRKHIRNGEELLSDTPQYGGIYALDTLTGNKLWEKIINSPVKNIFQIMDINSDGFNEYLAEIATVGPEWIPHPFNANEFIPEVFPYDYQNVIINGLNGSFILNATDEIHSYTNLYVHDMVSLNDLDDYRPEFIFLECQLKVNTTSEYFLNLTSYYLNGTQYNSNFIAQRWINYESDLPALERFPYNGEEHLLFMDQEALFLYNMNSSNFFQQIYNNTAISNVRDYTIVEDLNGDGFSEIITVNGDGNVSIISGADGINIRNFQIVGNFTDHWIDHIGRTTTDNEAIVFVKSSIYHDYNKTRQIQLAAYSITDTSEALVWSIFDSSDDDDDELKNAYVLHEDLDGDHVEELILTERLRFLYSTSNVRRIKIINIMENKELAILNIEYSGKQYITISDIDGDSKKDFSFSSDDRLLTLSSAKPAALWRSSNISWGFPTFIILVVMLGIGLILFAITGRKVSYKKEGLKEHKLTIIVNSITIGLMSVAFVLFLLQLNIFNHTLITGDNMTMITNVFLVVIITWYGMLPLTAALYNRFAPSFAFFFIRLRKFFFKLSKSYNTDIIVLDMGNRKEIGTLIQLKRVVLPLLLSIAIGFYTYNALTPILGYPQDFTIFGGTEFFQFMNGYMLCCIFPMILAFIVFSFFISGNFLLDDAGIVYFKQSKKYRKPSDIEPISVWAQSLIKGIAGLSAIITLIGFLATVDFSGFFGGGDGMTFIFGLFMVLVFFAGIPFLTAFSYILLAGEIMEFSMDHNVNKLYMKMKKRGYNTIPRKITNLYQSGYISPDNSVTDDTEEEIQ